MKRHYVDTGNEKDLPYSKAPCQPAEELDDVNWVPFWEEAGDVKEEESTPVPGPSISRAQDGGLESKVQSQQGRSRTPSVYQSCSQYYSCFSSITNSEENKSQQSTYAFYTRVQTVQGVAVAWETESGFESIGLRPRVREAEFTERQRREGSPIESISTSDLVSETDSWEGEAFQEFEEPETSVPSDSSQEIRETPDWLITTNYGLRCLACCRIFPNLEALLHHAQHGIKEGFSCHIFFREMLQRRQSHSEQQEQPPEDQDQGQSHSKSLKKNKSYQKLNAYQLQQQTRRVRGNLTSASREWISTEIKNRAMKSGMKIEVKRRSRSMMKRIEEYKDDPNGIFRQEPSFKLCRSGTESRAKEGTGDPGCATVQQELSGYKG
ncbi:protein FAM170B isoform X3 [Monodelphis domestica]|uniref:protein FAM170B isoform X3 n=1 Tax=Monodelphis domestica TaxID=13616 RepID=UPI0024E1EAB6|nr:protein FAM170B isoform X3 [Monodelphis domestica]